MKIGIDATSLTKEKITGIENYIRNFIMELSKIDHANSFSLYTPGPFYNFPSLPSNFKIFKTPKSRYWSQNQLPRLIKIDNPDVVFLPTNIIPHNIECRIVYHLHDLAWKMYPKAYGARELFRQYLSLKRAEKYADVIICSTHSTKKDIVKFTSIEENKIKTVPLGYNPDIRKYSNLPNRFGFVYCGRLEKRKNILNILSAYKTYCDSTEKPESLILCGAPGYGYRSIKLQISELKRAGYPINEKKYLFPETYYQLLGKAKVLVYPSLYEGFGLPILEAFACKTAVITSNISSMPEIAGNAALLVNPRKSIDIAKAMIKIVGDDKLRHDLTEKGSIKLKEYSWEITTKKILQILKNVN